MIEQAKFTYSPLGKVFEKQIKTRKDQGKALEEHGKQFVKSNAFPEKQEKSITLDKQKEILYNIIAGKI